MSISTAEFIRWKQDSVTQQLFKTLQDMRDNAVEIFSNEDVIMGDRCQITLAQAIGVLKGLDMVLLIHADDIVDEEAPIEE